VLCLFPFEPAIYAKHGVAATFVGHPLADAFPVDAPQKPAREALGLPPDAPVLALLAGSRLGEIRRLSNDFIGAAMRLRDALPSLRVVAPMASAPCRAAFEDILKKTAADFITVTDNRAHEAMLASDAILLASGTASLEAMLAKRPMVVAYRISPLTYRIVKGLSMLKTQHYSLPNALAGREIVPELMQDACTPGALASTLLPALRDRRTPLPLSAEYRHLHLALRRDASRSAAAAIAELIGGTASPVSRCVAD
jgi:lipid-A-disaccharide synthase